MNSTDMERMAREFAEDSGCGGIADEMTLDQLDMSGVHGPVVQAARAFLKGDE